MTDAQRSARTWLIALGFVGVLLLAVGAHRVSVSAAKVQQGRIALQRDRDALQRDRVALEGRSSDIESAVKAREDEVARRETVLSGRERAIANPLRLRAQQGSFATATVELERLRAAAPVDVLHVGALTERAAFVDAAGGRIGTAAKAVADAIQAQQRLLLGDSVESFKLQAIAEYELDRLRTLADALGLRTDAIPSNHFELIGDKRVLEALADAWEARLQRLDELRAGSTTGAFERASADARANVAAIRAAQLAPVVDLASIAQQQPTRIEGVELGKFEVTESARLSELSHREAQLLQKALAIDGGDVKALLRLRELERNVPLERLNRASALDSNRCRMGLRSGPAASLAELGRELMRSRIMDVPRAILGEALLELQWKALKDIGAAGLPDFTDWVVSHLDDVDLHEAISRSELALEASTSVGPVEKAQIKAELDAMRMHQAQRAAGHRAPPVTSPSVRFELSDLHSRAGRRALWTALERFEARNSVTDWSARERLTLEVAEWRDHISDLRRDTVRLAEWGRVGRGDPYLPTERTRLCERAAVIESGLTKLAPTTEAVQALQEVRELAQKFNETVTVTEQPLNAFETRLEKLVEEFNERYAERKELRETERRKAHLAAEAAQLRAEARRLERSMLHQRYTRGPFEAGYLGEYEAMLERYEKVVPKDSYLWQEVELSVRNTEAEVRLLREHVQRLTALEQEALHAARRTALFEYEVSALSRLMEAEAIGSRGFSRYLRFLRR